jgi:hypothetical protein
MPDPALIIPVRMDMDAAIAALKKVGTTTEAVGAAAKRSGTTTSTAFKGVATAAAGAGTSVGSLIKAQFGMAAVKATAGALTRQFSESSAHIMEMARQFQGLRKSMQEVATLRGSGNTNTFTLDEARKAQKAGLSPQERRDFQAEFLNYAGSQVGGPSGKLTDEQGEEFGSRVAGLMKQSGVHPAIGAELAGSLLENSKGPQNVDDLMKKFATTFQVLEKGRVRMERALPQISQIMGHGISAEESAQLFAIASPAAPGQEGTAVEGALRAVEKMKNENTGEEFGVRRGMSQFDSIKAFAENINQRKQEMMKGGLTDQKATDELNALLDERGVVSDVQERRGLINGFAGQGVALGAFKTYGDIASNTPADFEAQRKVRYERSEEALQVNADNAAAVAKAEEGERNDRLLRKRDIAETELTKSGQFEKFGVEQLGGLIPGAEGVREQQINLQLLRRGRAQLGESGVLTGFADTARSLSNGATDAAMRDMLKRIAESNERMQAQQEKDGKPPLVVPMPKPQTR